MDSQVTATTLTTSTKNIERYRALYSEYVTQTVTLHNAHTSFTKYLGLDTCKDVRRAIAKMNNLEKEMRRMAWLAHKEQNTNLKILREIEKENKRKSKVRTGKRGRPKKVKTDV